MTTPLNPLIESCLHEIVLHALAGQQTCTCPSAPLYASIHDRAEHLYALLTCAPWQRLDPKDAN